MKLDVAAGWGIAGIAIPTALTFALFRWPNMSPILADIGMAISAIFAIFGIFLIIRRPVAAALPWWREHRSKSIAQINLDQHMQNIHRRLRLTKRQKIMRFPSDFWTKQ